MTNFAKLYSSFNSHKNGSGHPTKEQMNLLDKIKFHHKSKGALGSLYRQI